MTQVNDNATLLGDYIKTVTDATPTYQIEIQPDENTVHDLFFPLAKYSDTLVLGNKMISTLPTERQGEEINWDPQATPAQITSAFTESFRERVESTVDFIESFRERIASGEYTPDMSFEMPESFTDRIASLIERRQKVLKEKMVWFTFGLEGRECYSSWPVAAYRFGASNQTCFNEPKVAPALRRLMKRNVIQGIRVTGPVPQHWYFGTIDHSE